VPVHERFCPMSTSATLEKPTRARGVCDACGASLKRIHRLPQDHQQPEMRRFACVRGGCSWQGLLPVMSTRDAAYRDDAQPLVVLKPRESPQEALMRVYGTTSVAEAQATVLADKQRWPLLPVALGLAGVLACGAAMAAWLHLKRTQPPVVAREAAPAPDKYDTDSGPAPRALGVAPDGLTLTSPSLGPGMGTELPGAASSQSKPAGQ
jgi:hypothetical protein